MTGVNYIKAAIVADRENYERSHVCVVTEGEKGYDGKQVRDTVATIRMVLEDLNNDTEPADFLTDLSSSTLDQTDHIEETETNKDYRQAFAIQELLHDITSGKEIETAASASDAGTGASAKPAKPVIDPTKAGNSDIVKNSAKRFFWGARERNELWTPQTTRFTEILKKLNDGELSIVGPNSLNAFILLAAAMQVFANMKKYTNNSSTIVDSLNPDSKLIQLAVSLKAAECLEVLADKIAAGAEAYNTEAKKLARQISTKKSVGSENFTQTIEETEDAVGDVPVKSFPVIAVENLAKIVTEQRYGMKSQEHVEGCHFPCSVM